MGANRVEALGHLVNVMVSSTEPTVRDNGDALEADDLWLDLGSSPQEWKAWDGSAFQTIGGGGGGSDADAIHDNVAGEIAALTLVTAASGDHVLVEDASDSNNKKRVAASDFLGGGSGGGTTWGDSIPSGNAPGGTYDEEFDGASHGLTAVETSAATYTLTGDALLAKQTTSDLRGLVKSIDTLTPPVTLTCAMRGMVSNADANNYFGGLVFTDSATDGSGTQLGLVFFLNTGSLNGFVSLREYTNWGSFSTQQFGDAMNVFFTPWVHLRLDWVSSDTWRAWWSPNPSPDTINDDEWIGRSGDWSRTLTPTHMGLWTNHDNATHESVFSFDYFRVWDL